jgi:hypothetical protein
VTGAFSGFTTTPSLVNAPGFFLFLSSLAWLIEYQNSTGRFKFKLFYDISLPYRENMEIV